MNADVEGNKKVTEAVARSLPVLAGYPATQLSIQLGSIKMKDRKLVQRGLLRRALRKQKRHASEAHADLIQLTLDDEAVFETLYESAMSNATRFGESTGAFSISAADDGSPIVDNLLKLLQWFVTNGPQLIEVIRLIVEMFGSISSAKEVCDAETIFVD